MRNRMIALLTVGALAVGSMAPALADKGEGGRRVAEQGKKFSDGFKDWNNDFWGNESLSRLILMGVMQGDGAGQIQSNKPVTRLEAIITVIRMLGLKKGDAAVNLDANTKAGIPNWGMDPVTIALQQGLLADLSTQGGNQGGNNGDHQGNEDNGDHGDNHGNHDKLGLNQPLTRLEAAVLLVKAAGLTAEAEAASGASLTFKDTQNLSASMKGYLSIAVDRGFIKGFDDGTFGPGKTLTRAEWATMLDRLDRNQGPAVRPDGRQVKGEVVAVTTADGLAALQVKTPVYPAGVTYKFDDAAVLYKDLKQIDMTQVNPGDSVILNLSADRKILMLTVYTAPPSVQQAAGTVTDWTAPSDQTAGSITFKGETAAAKTLPVAANASVKLGGSAGALSDVQLGDQVKMTVTNGAVSAIEIQLTKRDVTGTLKSVTDGTTTSRPKLTIDSGNPPTSLTFEVADWAELRKDGSATPITLADLAAGQNVKVTVERNLITKILVTTGTTPPPTNGQELTGQVSAWTAPTASAEGSIVVTKGNELKVFPVLKTAKVFLDTHAVTLADVQVGENVTVTITADNKVSQIKLPTAAQTVTGTLKATTPGSTTVRPTLTVQIGTAQQIYAVADWASFKRQGSDAALALKDLVANSSVKLTVQHGLVTKVEVTSQPSDATTLSGKVVAWIAPTAAAPGSIAVQVNTTDIKVFTVATTTSALLNDQPILLSEILVGDQVSLSIVGGAAKSIKISATSSQVTGTLKAVVSATASSRAHVIVETGTPAANQDYAVASWAEFKSNGAGITLNDLALGSSVELTVVHGLVTEVKVLP